MVLREIDWYWEQNISLSFVSCIIGQDRKAYSGEIEPESVRSGLGWISGPTIQSSLSTDRVHMMGIREGLSRMSWKLSRPVLRGGATGNGGFLLGTIKQA